MLVSHSIPKRAGFVSCLHLAELSVFPDRVIERLRVVALVFACLLGGLVPDQLHAQTPNLNPLNNYFITGDHVVRDFQYSSAAGGYVNGTITIPGAGSGDPEAIPDGAEIVAAFLYWQVLESAQLPPPPASDPGSNALFNGYSITADPDADPLPSDQGACGDPNSLVRSYRANVLPYLPVNSNGSSQAAGTHTVGLPLTPTGGGNQGASLVIVYRVLSGAPWAYLRATVIYEGNSRVGDGGGSVFLFSPNLPIRGFYDAVSSDGTDGNNKITDTWSAVAANGPGTASFLNFTSSTYSQPVADGANVLVGTNREYGIPPQTCMFFSTEVFTTRVKSADGDGILDAWKKGPAPPDTNAGKPGYYDVWDGSWVDLSGAQLGFQNGGTIPHQDIFVQYDWMVGADGHSHKPPQAALDMVTQAFINATVNVHFVPGNAIPEDTCADDMSQTPPLLCMFPGEPGVVAWKLGLEAIKAWPSNLVADSNPLSCNGVCTPRFQPGRKDSYHYLLFGHSLGLPTWNIADPIYTLKSMVVTNGNATVTTSATLTSCPSRVTIDGAIATPNLNGVYPNITCPSPLDATFTISNINTNKTSPYTVADGTYPNTLPEPFLAIYASKTDCSISPGCTDTTSGYSDVGGGDIAVTLGKWTWDNGQAIVSTDGECYVSSVHSYSSRCVNGLAGTVMHELGHNLTLLHGGRFYLNGSTTPEMQPNCKPQYQSVMNYLFQVDLLQSDAQDDRVPDYSWQGYLTNLDENNLSTTPGITPPLLYPYTKWFSPSPPFPTLINNPPPPPAYHCDGTPNSTNETAYEMEGLANSIAWSNGWDINFDGILGVLKDEGDDDWYNVDPRQIGASGNDNVGGAISTTQPPFNNAYMLGSYVFGPNGGIRAGGGGGIRAGGGGGIRAGGGGGIRAGGGGGIRAGGGGGIRAGGGGGVGEPNYNTIDSYPRPPRAVTASGGPVTWKPATFGNIVQYNVYRLSGLTSTLIACVYVGMPPVPSGSGCVQGDPYATSYTYSDNGAPANSTYLVTTVDLDPVSNLPRESTPQGSGAFQALLNLNVTTPLTYGSSETLTTTGGSTGGAVTFYLLSGPCSASGTQLTANSGTGSCSVAATMAGDSTYNPVTSAAVIVSLAKASSTTGLTSSANPSVFNAPVMFTATVSPQHSGVPTGTVTFKDGSTPIGNGTLNGSGAATYTTSALAVGSHTITAVYAGDVNFNGSSGTITDTIQSWTATGFYPPVVPTAPGTPLANYVWNHVKGGSTVPLKFNIYAGSIQQTSVGAVQGGTVEVYSITCAAGGYTNDQTDILQNTGATQLRYDTTGGQFIQNWQAPKGKNLCYQAIMTAADNVTKLQAYFWTN